MSRRTLAVLGAVVVVATVALAAIWLNAGLGRERLSWGEVAIWTVLSLSIAGVGAIIVTRADVRVIGWLLIGLAFSTASISLTDTLAIDRFVVARDTSFSARLAVSPPWWVPVFASLATIGFLFPSGRLPGARWRPVLAATFASYAALFAGIVLSDNPYEPPSDATAPVFDGVDPPFPGVPDWIWKPLGYGGLPLTFLSLLAATIAVIVRYRRARGVERLQLRWLAFAGSLVPLTLAICVFTSAVLGDLEGTLVGLLLVASVLAVTASVAIAVTRYRLYEIDRVVNRTLVYGTATALLLALWFCAALVVGLAAGRGSPWASGVATGLVALLVRPVRDRVQTGVDRRFSRARFRAGESIRTFERAVREGEAEPEGIGAVVAAALGDPGAELLFLLPASERYVDALGQAVDEAAMAKRSSSPVERRGSRIGLLLHEQQLLQRPDLLRVVLKGAALTVEVARLRLELRAQLAEVERSRERIVHAGYEERRRLERDLHDGAQQRLVTLGLTLRRAERSLPREARILAPALAQAVDEIGRAVADLRRLAAGVRPALLDEGLSAALEELARTSAVPVHVDAPRERLPAVVEAAAYFVACEAITNAVKHAQPSRVRVHVHRDDGTLTMVVDDDGVGGARIGRGSGLQGLLDRVQAHGGELRLESPRGSGTRVAVELPCAS